MQQLNEIPVFYCSHLKGKDTIVWKVHVTCPDLISDKCFLILSFSI